MCNTVNLQRIYIISRKRYRQSMSRYWHLNLCSLSKQAVLKLLVLHKRKYYWRHKLRLSPQSCRRRCFEFLSNDFFPYLYLFNRKQEIIYYMPYTKRVVENDHDSFHFEEKNYFSGNSVSLVSLQMYELCFLQSFSIYMKRHYYFQQLEYYSSRKKAKNTKNK